MSRTVATSTTVAGSTTTAGRPPAPVAYTSNENDESEEGGGTKTCRQLGRLMLLLLGGIAVACSVFAMLSCSFFDQRASIEETIGVDVLTMGLFSFQEGSQSETDSTSTTNIVEDLTGQSCQSYDGRFLQPANWMSPFWTVAQFAAVVAPSLGASAWLLILMELCWGAFRGSFLLPILLSIGACAVQGCTFFMLGQLDVCYADVTDSQSDGGASSCRLSYGAFLSISAGFAYYLVSVGLCCLPRPDPWCRKSGASGAETQGDNQRGADKDATTSSDAGTDEEMPSSPSGRSSASTGPTQRYSWQQVY